LVITGVRRSTLQDTGRVHRHRAIKAEVIFGQHQRAGLNLDCERRGVIVIAESCLVRV
jgi:hypothetical protein